MDRKFVWNLQESNIHMYVVETGEKPRREERCHNFNMNKVQKLEIVVYSKNIFAKWLYFIKRKGNAKKSDFRYV